MNMVDKDEEGELMLGANIYINYGFKTTPKYARSIGCDFFQIFLRNPRSYAPNPRDEQSLKDFKKRLKKYTKGCVVHSSYSINLARPTNMYQHFKGVEVLVEDLNHSVKIGAIGAIIHMGKNVKDKKRPNDWITDEEAFSNYVKGVESALRKSDKRSVIILETGAGCGTEICTKLEKLASIRDRIDKKYRHRIKYCIDTCHIFSAGYPIHSLDYVDFLSMGIDMVLGWENIAVIHLNDSKVRCGSKVDSHADIGKGYIGEEPLIKFIKICKKHSVPIVLETPCDEYDGERFTHKEQIKIIRERLNDQIDSDVD